MVMASLHEQLLGRWIGEGSGEYPTIQPFTYRETIEISQVPGKPLARWQTTTADAESGEPRHSEVGFLRSTGDSCELVLAHNFGITEITVATPSEAGLFRFESQLIACSPTAKSVTEVIRTISVQGNTLEYDVSMAAVGLGMTHHLAARLTRG